MSVRFGPVCCLRLWCSPRYQRISPLHREFHTPLPTSSHAVSLAGLKLSSRILRMTNMTALTPFTPSDSDNAWGLCITAPAGTELGAPYSCGTVNNFIPHKRCLRAEALHPSRGRRSVRLRPLRKILDCASRRSMGRVSVPSVGVSLSAPLNVVALVSHYLTN